MKNASLDECMRTHWIQTIIVDCESRFPSNAHRSMQFVSSNDDVSVVDRLEVSLPLMILPPNENVFFAPFSLIGIRTVDLFALGLELSHLAKKSRPTGIRGTGNHSPSPVRRWPRTMHVEGRMLGLYVRATGEVGHC